MSILKHLTLIQTIAKATDQTIDTLCRLAIQFRAAQLFTHNAHIKVTGDNFLSDHEWLGALYPQFEGYYDSLVERIMGLGGSPLIDRVNTEATAISASVPMPGGDASNDDYFEQVLAFINQAVTQIDVAAKEPTMDEGVRDLIVGISNELQVQQYKLRQRLGGDVAKAKDGGVAKTEETMATFTRNFKQLGACAANIGKAGKGWFHGNQVEPGSTSVRADKYAAKMREAKEHAKSGSALQSKASEYEAAEQWKKMAPGERGHAMKLVSDSASEDIGKSRERGFEFGHGKSRR